MNPGTNSPISIQNAGFLQQTWPKSVHYKEAPAHRKNRGEKSRIVHEHTRDQKVLRHEFSHKRTCKLQPVQKTITDINQTHIVPHQRHRTKTNQTQQHQQRRSRARIEEDEPAVSHQHYTTLDPKGTRGSLFSFKLRL